MRMLNQIETKEIHGAAIKIDGSYYIVSSKDIPQDKFQAIEKGFQKCMDDEWDENRFMVYLCATNSFPYYSTYMSNFLFDSYRFNNLS